MEPGGSASVPSVGEKKESIMSNGEPVDRPNRETVQVRQGTGPRNMVSVLLAGILLAAVAGLLLLAYFNFVWPTTGS
jgi:hypothetical protein